MMEHKTSKKRTKLSEGIQKYGWENFNSEIVVIVPVDDLCRVEVEYIAKERTFLDRRHYNGGGDPRL